jgi:hypothetical protein
VSEADWQIARRAYEADVRELRTIGRDMLARGCDDETVARYLVQQRNELKQRYRAFDDPAIVALMEARNFAKCGNPLGPDVDQLFRRYGSWTAVIDAAARPARLT